MQRKLQKRKYDTIMKGRAFTGLALRAAVAGYMVYLAWKIFTNMLGGSSAIPLWAVWLICIVFAAVAVIFCVYSWKAFRKALKEAEIVPVPDSKSNKSDTSIDASECDNDADREDN